MDHIELALSQLCASSGGFVVETTKRAYPLDSEQLCGLPCGNKAAYLAKPSKAGHENTDLPICEACTDRFKNETPEKKQYLTIA